MIKELHKKTTRFNYTTRLLLAATGMLIVTSAGATNWYVNDASLTGDVFTSAAGNDSNSGTAAAPFASIQFAINTATAGDTIYVDAGIYVSGDIDVSKPVSLRGAKFGVSAGPADVPANRGTDETIIEGSIYFGQSQDNISVDGFTLHVGTALRGIQARGLNSVVINNIVTGTITPSVQQQGIATRANAPDRTHSYLISHNNVRGFKYGIYMDGATDNPSEISYNYVTGCLTAGFVFTASDGHHIKANVSENNSQGMTFTEGSNLVDQNTITGNALIGIRLSATPLLAGNVVSNNFFINNGIAVDFTEDDPGAVNNQVNYNSFSGNILNIVNGQSANSNAQCNWFGSTIPALIALQINGNINFNPFLTDGTDTDPSTDGFQPITSCTVLPILLTDLSAVVKQYDVLLKWQTASEVNSSHFIVERSLDNQHFSGIGRVEAKGFSDARINYGFTDNKPVNFDKPTYYRLAMVDRDGTTKYSKIVSIVLKTNGSYVQQVFPNPAKAGSLLHTNFISGSRQTVDVSFIDATGQVLAESKFQALKGSNELNISIPSHAASGINFLRIRSADIKKQVPVYIN